MQQPPPGGRRFLSLMRGSGSERPPRSYSEAVDRARARRVQAAVIDAGRRARSPVELERAVAGHIAQVVPYDLWCGLTIDPATGYATGGYHDEGLPADRMPRLVEIENGPEPDFLDLRELAEGSRTARTGYRTRSPPSPVRRSRGARQQARSAPVSVLEPDTG